MDTIKDLKDTKKRLHILLKIKSKNLEEESTFLFKKNEELLKEILELKQHEQNYLSAIDKTNEAREKGRHAIIRALDESIDFFKKNWAICLKNKKRLENEVDKIKKNLEQMIYEKKQIEKMEENLSKEILKKIEDLEYKQQEEYSKPMELNHDSKME